MSFVLRVDADGPLLAYGFQQRPCDLFTRVPGLHAEILVMADSSILRLDVIRPLRRDHLVWPRQRVLRDRRHKGLEIQMMNGVARRLQRRLQSRPDPFNVVFHAPLQNRKSEAGRNLINGLDPLLYQLLKDPSPSRQVVHPARRLVLGTMIPERAVVRGVTMAIGFYPRRRG